MKLPVSIAKKLIAMQNGEKIPFSKMKHPAVDEMLENGILRKQIQGRSQAWVYITNRNVLCAFLKNHLGIDSLESYVNVLKQTELRRADTVEISSDSKLKSIRTFKGFLVNCIQPTECILNGKPFMLVPQDGTFTFIYDFENFEPNTANTIVGIENPENFRHVQKQIKLFDSIQPLFVSRYPYSKDLIKWLKRIPNNYLHFGDFDFAGINIYFNEYKKHLKGKANFFLPPDIEQLIASKGNRDNYNKQELLFEKGEIQEENILILIGLIEKYKKGLEQEIFAK